jgi:hypothetical protein
VFETAVSTSCTIAFRIGEFIPVSILTVRLSIYHYVMISVLA